MTVDDRTLWLPVTIVIFYGAAHLQRIAGRSPLVNPTLLSIVAIGALLLHFDIPHPRYFEAVSVLHYLLGTAVVALAVPLSRHLRAIEGSSVRLGAALLLGSVSSIVVGLLVAKALGAIGTTLLSIGPKSATAAVSIGIAQGIGGIPAIAACSAIVTGITGAILGPYILGACRVVSPSARGLALGTASHGIATAQAFRESESTGSHAALAMVLNAIVTAAFVPPIIRVLGTG